MKRAIMGEQVGVEGGTPRDEGARGTWGKRRGGQDVGGLHCLAHVHQSLV